MLHGVHAGPKRVLQSFAPVGVRGHRLPLARGLEDCCADLLEGELRDQRLVVVRDEAAGGRQLDEVGSRP